jgi:glycosyltransferase involved in cell wall biosynthesis
LVIFGEGSERQRLESLRHELGLDADVDLPGIIDNPYAAMRRASLYVLSSRFEGLPNALIEALACGCPAVSTECPDGPAEILSSQSFGQLVPVAQPEALAAAIVTSLDRRWDRKKIAGRGAEFSLERSLDQYLTALDYPLPAVALSRAA